MPKLLKPKKAMKLNDLQIKTFRGATIPLTVNFDPAKKITMIFGENGDGKSTIADAFICLCSDNFGSLDDKSSVDKSYLKSIGSRNESAIIELHSDSQTFKATLGVNSKSFAKTPNTGFPEVKYLRRSQIINLINLQASDRYTALKDYIDVSNIYKSEE